MPVYEVRKPLRYAGRDYARGDEITSADIGNWLREQQLAGNRFIEEKQPERFVETERSEGEHEVVRRRGRPPNRR